eukprot:6531200-Alexandrium_andersonii.AAC.1
MPEGAPQLQRRGFPRTGADQPSARAGAAGGRCWPGPRGCILCPAGTRVEAPSWPFWRASGKGRSSHAPYLDAVRARRTGTRGPPRSTPPARQEAP